MKKNFGKILAELRREAGLSQEELAERAGFHHTYISQLERNLKSPTLVTIQSLAGALGTKASKILRRLESNEQ